MIWDSYFHAVTGISDEKRKQKAETQISVFSGLQILETGGHGKRTIPDEIYRLLMEEAFAYDSLGCEPLVF